MDGTKLIEQDIHVKVHEKVLVSRFLYEHEFIWKVSEKSVVLNA